MKNLEFWYFTLIVGWKIGEPWFLLETYPPPHYLRLIVSRNLLFKTNAYFLSKQNKHIWGYIRFSGRTPCQSWTGLRYQIVMLRAKFWGQINDVINDIIFTTFIQKWLQYNHIGTSCSPIHRFSFNKFQNISPPLPRLIDPPPTIR